jgi:transposase
MREARAHREAQRTLRASMQATSEQSFTPPEQMALLTPEAEEGSGASEQAPSVADVSKRCSGRRYKQGLDTAQPMLLPPSVEDYVSKDNPVRAIRAYVDTLDLSAFDVQHAAGALSAGQPAYDPADLLALYLYGYLTRVRSGRRLQAECERNLEPIWLLRGLRPKYHTIADFRKHNAKALVAVNRDFVQLCRELGLFGGKLVGIDGSFFNGNASHASVKTDTQLKAELAAIERDIERYRQESEETDAAEANVADGERLTPEQLAELQARAERKREQIEQLDEAGETQLSRTDPDARRLSKNGRKVTGYNVQSVVDATTPTNSSSPTTSPTPATTSGSSPR